MKFNANVEKKAYIDFYNKNDRTFMQSYEWGQFNKKSRNQIPYYVGLEDESGNLVCASLLLKKVCPFGYSYFYAPRGYLIDYNDKNLLKEFTLEINKFMKSQKAIFLRQDPEIIYHDIDIDGSRIVDGNNNYELYNYLLSLGYKHTGFTKEFESNQPRYTFRIDLTRELSIIEKGISKSIMKKIHKTFEYGMEFRETTDTDTFYDLIQNNSEKDNFSSYSKNYYKDEYNILGKNNIIKIFELVIYPDKLYADFNTQLSLIDFAKSNSKQSVDRLNKLIKLLEEVKDQKEMVICSQICALTTDGMWTLYIGNNNIGTELYAVNRMYYEIIKYAKDTNHKFLDLFGTIGSTKIKHTSLIGIHNYKKNYGGTYIEFIGEFDYIYHKFLYYSFLKLVPIYRKLKKIVKK
mgnify:CR=1 FL=1